MSILRYYRTLRGEVKPERRRITAEKVVIDQRPVEVARIARYIDQLAILRHRKAMLEQDTAECRQIILDAGGGVSRNWMADIIQVRGYEHYINPHRRIQLTAK